MKKPYQPVYLSEAALEAGVKAYNAARPLLSAIFLPYTSKRLALEAAYNAINRQLRKEGVDI